MLACALALEEGAARRAGADAVRVGLGARLPAPPGPLVSFGLAGALVGGLEPGDVVSAARVVATDGRTLWEGAPLLPGAARPVAVVSAEDVVDDPHARTELARASGAQVVDLESAALAVSGRLAGVLRVVSDTPAAPVGRLACAVTDGGETRVVALALAFVLEPRAALRGARNGRRALVALERAARELAAPGPHGRDQFT